MHNFKNKYKKAFSLVEVLVAMAISGITIVTMTKLSIDVTQQAVKNLNADKATQISSSTSDLLLKLRNQNPQPYSCVAEADAGSNYSGKYLIYDQPTNNFTFGAASASTDTKITKVVPQLNGESVIFVKDANLILFDMDLPHYRSIGLAYNAIYKVVVARIVIYWNIYGEDYFYVNYATLSLNNICT